MRKNGMTMAAAWLAAALMLSATASAASPPPPSPHVYPAAIPAFVPGQLLVRFKGRHQTQKVQLPSGIGVRAAAAALRRDPAVSYAVPNYIATASEYPLPNDPGTAPGEPVGEERGWVERQWNFLPCGSLCGGDPEPYESLGGIDAISAWRHLRAAGHEGASDVRIAVLDTGVAYRPAKGGFRRSPDFSAKRFARGYDFVQDDSIPLDLNGHGTHVAGTIGEDTGNGIGVTGLAYRAKLIPVRVLDPMGRGRADQIAAGIRYAATHGADVINMSFNFPCAASVPDVASAIRFAYEEGAVLVASDGNAGVELCISAPATDPHVIGVGGTTEGACPGFYSLPGDEVDIVAPGGGISTVPCVSGSRPIVQVTLRSGSRSRFGLPDTYVGTSMAAAHISGVAAMVIASRVLGPDPKPSAVVKRLRATARDLGAAGEDATYGAGLVDAGAATAPVIARGAGAGADTGVAGAAGARTGGSTR